MSRKTRPISWIKAARKEFDRFPDEVQLEIELALTIAAEGGKADTAKPMTGLGAGVFEIALRFRREAYRAVYALHIGRVIWVVHAFQKKSKFGIKTPQLEINVIRQRIKRLKEMLS